SVKRDSLKGWVKSGSPWVWLNAGAVSIAVIMTLGLLLLIGIRGMGHFWPADIIEATYQVPGEPARLLAGELVESEEVPRARLAGSGLPVDAVGGEFMTRQLIKVGNREVYGADFSWIVGEWLSDQRTPADLMAIERREWGNFYGYLIDVKQDGVRVADGEAAWPALQERLTRGEQLHTRISRLERTDIGAINAGLERLRLETRRLELNGELDEAAQARLAAERAEWDARYA